MRAALLAVLVTTAARAGEPPPPEPRPPRETALVRDRGTWSFGIFDPLRIAVDDRVELQASPLIFFVAPNLEARFALLKPPRASAASWVRPGLHLTAEAGLSLPTLGMRLMKGFFFPSWELSSNDVGWMLIPHVGVLLSGDVLTHDVWTVRADTAFRVPLGPSGASRLDSFLTPLNIVLAAPLTGFIARIGAAYDHAFGTGLRLRGELNLFVTGAGGALVVDGVDRGPVAGLDPFIVSAHVQLDIAVFRNSRVTVGVYWANENTGQRAVVADADGYSTSIRVRSNTILPTVDFIWAGP